MFSDKTLLITGGTGSFGNAVLRRFLYIDDNSHNTLRLTVYVNRTVWKKQG